MKQNSFKNQSKWKCFFCKAFTKLSILYICENSRSLTTMSSRSNLLRNLSQTAKFCNIGMYNYLDTEAIVWRRSLKRGIVKNVKLTEKICDTVVLQYNCWPRTETLLKNGHYKRYFPMNVTNIFSEHLLYRTPVIGYFY